MKIQTKIQLKKKTMMINSYGTVQVKIIKIKIASEEMKNGIPSGAERLAGNNWSDNSIDHTMRKLQNDRNSRMKKR